MLFYIIKSRCLWNHAKQKGTKTKIGKMKQEFDLWNHAKQKGTQTSDI